MTLHPRIVAVAVAAQGGYLLTLGFTDGSVRMVDLAPLVEGRNGVFAPLQNPAFFARVSVDVEAGTIVWPNGADLDPDVLYEAAHSADVR